MKVAHINTFSFGSTGNIAKGICKKIIDNGDIAYLFVPYETLNVQKADSNTRFFGNRFSRWVGAHLDVWTGFLNCFDIVNTISLIRKLKRMKPDIIHLHNIHPSCVNISMLFKYAKRKNINVVWTLHDCWSFTGRCPYFDILRCDQWKNGCKKCKYPLSSYPQSHINMSKYLYKKKRKIFNVLDKMVIVTPSLWLANLVKESFLSKFPVKVINNGIDLNVFQPHESGFRIKYGLENKFIILGVADVWDKRKGFDIFLELSKKSDSNYQIVLVGTNELNDRDLPPNVISIHKTYNQVDLVNIYSDADLFVNPTREDNYPTVNMESLACGTPVLTFETGGSAEIIDKTCGSSVRCEDIEGLINEIDKIYKTKPFIKQNCLIKAQTFNKDYKFSEYLNLYEKTVKNHF